MKGVGADRKMDTRKKFSQGKKMENIQIMNRKYETVVWGLLAILWGITILFDFIPFGVGVLGTGMVMLGVNVVRSLNDLPTKNDNTVFGILMLAWGGLELGRPILRSLFGYADLDWVIFAILLIGLGLILSLHGFLCSQKIGEDSFVNTQKE
jgi:hypothetical protein